MCFPSWLIHPSFQMPLEPMGWFAAFTTPTAGFRTAAKLLWWRGNEACVCPSPLHPQIWTSTFGWRGGQYFFHMEERTLFANIEIWLSCLQETSTHRWQYLISCNGYQSDLSGKLSSWDLSWWPTWMPCIYIHKVGNLKSQAWFYLSVIHHIHCMSSMWQAYILSHSK